MTTALFKKDGYDFTSYNLHLVLSSRLILSSRLNSVLFNLLCVLIYVIV